MRRSSIILSVCFLLISSSLRGHVVNLKGSGKGYENAVLRIFIQSDPVTKRLKPVFRVTCDSDGSFNCEIPLEKYGVLFIKAGIYTLCLYTPGDCSYEIRMPDYVPRPAGEDNNPFFVETRIIPEVISDTNDINNMIRDFDEVYNPLFNMVADRIALNYRTSEINPAIAGLNSISANRTDPFSKDFVRFRLMMINNVASGQYQGRVEDMALINSQFIPENPAYLDLIEQRYSGYFMKLSTGNSRDTFINAISSASLEGLRNLVTSDSKVTESQLQDYIILLNLYSGFYEGSVPQRAVLRIMTALDTGGASEYIRELASTLSEYLVSLLPGNKPPDVSLRNNMGTIVSINDFAGKYVLLSFTRSDNTSAMLEYGILKMWSSNYRDDLEVVAILRDGSFGDALQAMRKNGFDWVFLDGSDSDLLDYKYDIRMYPSFILLDREGRIIRSSCPFPSENLESYIRAIIRTGR